MNTYQTKKKSKTNKEYCVREDRKDKILLVKSTYINKEEKEKDILPYGILDVGKNEYPYYTEGIDVAKRLERNRSFYDDNNPNNTDKQLICTSHPKEE